MIHRSKQCTISCVALIALVFIGSSYNCKEQTSSMTHARLKEYIDSIRVVNTHEHIRSKPAYEGHDYNLYTVLANSYINADMISAGGPKFDAEIILMRLPYL